MTESASNPFVLPGMGQSSPDMAGNPLLASMEMMRKAWAGLTGPGGLAQALPMTPPMNLEDLERRIAELRAVESWLRLNLSMLGSTIQGMEVQRATIATLRSFVDSVGAQGADAANWSGASPLEVALGLKPAPRSAAAERPGSASAAQAAPSASGSQDQGYGQPPPRDDADAPAPDAGASAGADSSGSAASADPAAAMAGSAQAISNAAQSASEAWWGMLQQQFSQIATATAATMPGSKSADHEAKAAGPGSGPVANPGNTPVAKAAGKSAGKAAGKAATKSSTKAGAKSATKANTRSAARPVPKAAVKVGPGARASARKIQSGSDKS